MSAALTRTRARPRAWRTFALGVTIALLVTSCGPTSAPTSTPTGGAPSALAANQVLRVGLQADIGTGFDPGIWIGTQAAIGRDIFSFLVRVDRNGKTADQLVPDLAESWTISP